jgi:coenzyme Q-binding protein COQ10
MPVFQTSKLVNVSAATAYAVAADVAAYREFLPLIHRSVIKGQETKTTQGLKFEAELAISYPKLGLAQSFVSQVETDDRQRSVMARSSDGPFRAIETEWRITPAGPGSTVAIRIDYAFRNPLMQLAAGGLMDMAIGKVMAAFEARAMAVQRAASMSS